MRVPSPSRYGHLFLLIICLFSSLLNAVNLGQKFPPKGPLGIRLDYELATLGTGDGPPNYVFGSKNVVFSTHLTFNEPVSSITNGQLAQMLKDAWKELAIDAEQYSFNAKRLPGVVTFFAFGNEVILSSSLRGPSFTYEYGASPVKESLAICMAVWKDQTGEEKTHVRGASCGEMMCAHQYYQVHTTPLKDANVRSLTGFYFKNDDNLGFIAECGTKELADWGCNLFVSQNNIDYLDLGTQVEAYDLNTLAGGIKTIDQIRMC